jgi:hypothetical protein
VVGVLMANALLQQIKFLLAVGVLMANALLQQIKFLLVINRHLKDLIVNLNSNTSIATYVYTNSYDVVVEVVQNYQQFGEHSFSFSLVA